MEKEQEPISVLATSFQNKFKVLVETEHHTIIADEPISVGGLDKGMAPFEIFLASLAACKNITLQMYCNHKNLEIHSFRIKLLLVELDGGAKKIIEQISFQGDVDESVQKRLIHVSKSCPVSKMLSKDIEVESNIL